MKKCWDVKQDVTSGLGTKLLEAGVTPGETVLRGHFHLALELGHFGAFDGCGNVTDALSAQSGQSRF